MDVYIVIKITKHEKGQTQLLRATTSSKVSALNVYNKNHCHA